MPPTIRTISPSLEPLSPGAARPASHGLPADRLAPTRVSTLPREEIARRAVRARASIAACNLCERRCGINRLAGEAAPCGLADDTWSFKRHVSYAEEPELLPSYMVYFSACNYRCRFCVQGPACFSPRRGAPVDATETAADLARAVERGARTINLLGGEPSLHLHTILDIAAASARPLPLVLNTNMYMTPEVIEQLDGVVTGYIADFKFGNDECAQRLAEVAPYVGVVQRNLRLAAKRADVFVRHLLMPGHLDCCFRPVAEWVAANLPAVRFTLMTGYVPAGRADGCAELGRCLTVAERHAAERIVADLGLASGPPSREEASPW